MAQSISCDAKTNDVLFRKYEIKQFDAKAKIIVPDTHNAIIVNDGIALETLPAGKYLLFDKKKGVLKDLEVKDNNDLDVYVIFVSKTAKLKIDWGTTDKFDMRDPVTGAAIQLGASGEFEVQISNPRKAYLELIGQLDMFDTELLQKRLLGRLLAKVQYHLANAMREKNLSYDRLGEILLPMSEEILPHIAELFDKDYGLKVFSFTISRVLIDEDNTKKIQSAKDAHQKIEMDKAEKANKERLDEIAFQRQVNMRRIEQEGYDKYLEVAKTIGWPQPKKDGKTSESECPNCGVKITKDAKFCPVCGTEIKITKIKCPFCGKAITADSMFCKHCGAKVKE